MPVVTHTFTLDTRGEGDTHDVTGHVEDAIQRSGLESGVVTVFVPGSTAGITTIEYESGAVSDLGDAMERIAPRDGEYRHNQRWGDGNGFSHVRAAVMGASLAVPFAKRRLLTGTWQQIILVDFDNRARRRQVVCQVIGE